MPKKKAEDMTKEERIRKERNRIKKVLAKLSKEKQELAAGLMDLAAFQRIELEDMRKDIAENGYTEKFSQSSSMQPYDRERPISKMFMMLQGKYKETITALCSMMPKSEVKAAETDLMEEYIRMRSD